MKALKKLSRYRHESTLDVDIIVAKVLSKHFYKVYYYNRHYNFIYDFDPEIVMIKDLDLWTEIT